jgi:hypothetical protein
MSRQMDSKGSFFRYVTSRLRALYSPFVLGRVLFNRDTPAPGMSELEIMEVLKQHSSESLINPEVENLMTEILRLKETGKFQEKIIEMDSMPNLNKRDKEFYTTMLEWQYLRKVIEYLRNELSKTLGKPKLNRREETIRGGLRRLIQRSKELEQKGRSLIYY